MPHRRASAAALLLLLFFAYGAHADDIGLKLKIQPTLIPYAEGGGEPVPLFLEADRAQGTQERELEAEGGVRLRKRGYALFADHVFYAVPEEELTATGNVRMDRGGDIITGDKAFYRLGTDSGYIENPTYSLRQFHAHGTARELVAQSGEVYEADKATFTTCDAGHEDWYFRVDRLNLDRERDIGVAHGTTMVFKDLPVLYTPYLDFSLSGRRKSGLLPPTIGSTGNSGFEYTQPYYWNIAPDRDATIAPRIMAKRGVQLNGEFRYLEPDLSGESRAEWLPDDRIKGETRYGLSWQHRQNFGEGFSGAFNLQGVSDDTYFTDLSTKISATSLTNLPREGNLFYDGDWWNVNTRVQRFQTLQDPLAPVVPPYARVPQITLNANRHTDTLVDLGLQGEFVEFNHPYLVNGQRQTVYPSIALPLQTSYVYVTPKVGYHVTRYSFSDPNRVDEVRQLPIYSLDSAVTFERDTDWLGRSFVQTLEPRLYYVYIPFRPQDQLPNFDTALADFNLAQIFTENQFTGGDRINDANQLTAAVTSRFIDPRNGDEDWRFTLGQRYYFKEQQVSLDANTRTSDKSDLLAEVAGRIIDRWTLAYGLQYSTNENRVERTNTALRYQPEPGRVVNFGYRFTRESLEQLDFSTQWPVGRRWNGLARWNYSLRDRQLLEGLAGVEYNAGCWAARFVMQRFVTSTQQYTNALFFQLELSGISQIGSSAQELLRQNITGYGKANVSRPVDYNPFPEQ
jgi:LPS-assembly protein